MADPAFLFYDGDAAKDVSHMNRLERGCYFDIIQAQRKFGRLSIYLIKKILGKDFDSCWEGVKICLSYDNDMYYIEWLEISTLKRKEYSESRKRNRMKQKSEDMLNISQSYDEHMVNENEIINEDLNKDVVLEKDGTTPKLEEVLRYGEGLGISKEDSEDFFNIYESQGWKTAGEFEKKIYNWRAKMALFKKELLKKARDEIIKQPNKTNGKQSLEQILQSRG